MGDQDKQKSEFPMVKNPSSVLFLCDHNVIRSPMAEALAKQKFGTSVFFASAGVRAGTPDAFVTAVMNELSIDLENHTPIALEDLEDSFFDVIISLSPTAQHTALQMEHIQATEINYWPAEDPTLVQGSRQQRLEAYRSVRDHLNKRISERFGG